MKKIIEGQKTVPMIQHFILFITTSVPIQITWFQECPKVKMLNYNRYYFQIIIYFILFIPSQSFLNGHTLGQFFKQLYLTNLTTSSSITGKTPHKLWHGNCPSVNHLWEIGCKAYALVPSPNPKVLQWSVPCKLIGYAPNSKAYQPWDPTTGHIFNSFHIEFVKHLDALPYKLIPGVTAGIDTGVTIPPYDTYSVPSLPSPIRMPHTRQECIHWTYLYMHSVVLVALVVLPSYIH